MLKYSKYTKNPKIYGKIKKYDKIDQIIQKYTKKA